MTHKLDANKTETQNKIRQSHQINSLVFLPLNQSINQSSLP